MANAAAAPAACPVAMQVAWMRKAEFAKRSDERMRPATMKFDKPLGINAPRGTVGTCPGWIFRLTSPCFASCRSTG